MNSSETSAVKMPRETRSKYVHWHIGSCTDVLREDFVEEYCRGDPIDLSTSRPFSGPLMLPTKGEALKLWWFLKDEDGRYNGKSLLNGKITGMVVSVISHYWKMAGFESEAEDLKLNDGTKHKLVSSIVKTYQSLLKSRSKNSDKAEADRKSFSADMGTCLNFGVKNLRNKLLSDRVRKNLGVQGEDVDFLDDQFGPRKRWSMSPKEDQEFANRKEANLKRKLPPVTQPLEEDPPALHDHGDDGDEQFSDEDKENQDRDFVVATKSRKKSDRITVTVPRNLLSPAVVSSLDRTKESSSAAMRNIAALVSTFETPGGEKVGLEDFNLSRSTIERGRLKGRESISLEAKSEFLLNLPDHLTLHWDGSMMVDILGIKNEVEAMLAAGGSGKYREGKLLDIVELKDKDGKNTSTGEAQAKAVYASIQEWGILAVIRAFVFDTTASNTGWQSGATVRLNFMLGRVILYLACRHHIMELLAKNPFHLVMGYDPSPDVQMFKRLKEIWNDIDTTGPIITFELEPEQREELILTYTDILTKHGVDGELFVRGDYRDLCKMALVMIGGKLPGDEIYRWPPPGACHKARFLMFALHTFRLLGLSDRKEVRDR